MPHDQYIPPQPPHVPYGAPPPEQQLVYESTPAAWPPAGERREWSQQPMRPGKQPKSPWLFAGVGTVIGLALGLVIGVVGVPAIASGVAALAPSPFDSAIEQCDLDKWREYAIVGDEGATLEVQTEGSDVYGLEADEFTCLLDALNVSDAVMSRLSNTRALDGRQEASWGDFTASWTYHPTMGSTC